VNCETVISMLRRPRDCAPGEDTLVRTYQMQKISVIRECSALESERLDFILLFLTHLNQILDKIDCFV
jgi:hypothetical protein